MFAILCVISLNDTFYTTRRSRLCYKLVLVHNSSVDENASESAAEDICERQLDLSWYAEYRRRSSTLGEL